MIIIIMIIIIILRLSTFLEAIFAELLLQISNDVQTSWRHMLCTCICIRY